MCHLLHHKQVAEGSLAYCQEGFKPPAKYQAANEIQPTNDSKIRPSKQASSDSQSSRKTIIVLHLGEVLLLLLPVHGLAFTHNPFRQAGSLPTLPWKIPKDHTSTHNSDSTTDSLQQQIATAACPTMLMSCLQT
jgi:hypothetical protein